MRVSTLINMYRVSTPLGNSEALCHRLVKRLLLPSIFALPMGCGNTGWTTWAAPAAGPLCLGYLKHWMDHLGAGPIEPASDSTEAVQTPPRSLHRLQRSPPAADPPGAAHP